MKKIIKKAFTLIELLVVIAIVGILSGLIIVGMNGMTQKATIAKSQVFSNSLRNSLLLKTVAQYTFDDIIDYDPSTKVINSTAGNIPDSWSDNEGRAYNGPILKEGDDCISGKCVSFDGVDDYLNCGNSSNLDISSITVSAWIKIGSSLPPNWGTVIAKGNQADNDHFWLSYQTAGNFRFEYGNETTRVSASYNIIPSLNTWYHVAATYTSGSGYVYINGARGGQQTGLTGNLGINTYFLTIGKCSYASSHYWNGFIDDIRLFNEAMPTSQIREQYYAGLNKLFINGSISTNDYVEGIKSSELSIR